MYLKDKNEIKVIRKGSLKKPWCLHSFDCSSETYAWIFIMKHTSKDIKRLTHHGEEPVMQFWDITLKEKRYGCCICSFTL